MKSKPTKKEVVTAFRTREILTAAREVMERLGVEAATMDEIAQTAGIAKGTIYLYFQGKEELIQALMSQVGENMHRDLKAVIDTAFSPRDKLPRVLAVLVDYLERERALFPIYMRDFAHWMVPGGRKRFGRIRELEGEILALLNHLFSEGVATGDFIPADPKLLTFLLRSLVRGVGFYGMAEGRSEAIKEALPVLVTFMLSGLTPPPASTAEVHS
ncbi:MAG: TetR/AcrR family transcriptional regulator [Deltaproteobacteria bacterium]|nr:TetR/AcrR family transcriptional regulator [Deltaproteobacteria bacterium]